MLYYLGLKIIGYFLNKYNLYYVIDSLYLYYKILLKKLFDYTIYFK